MYKLPNDDEDYYEEYDDNPDDEDYYENLPDIGDESEEDYERRLNDEDEDY